MMLMIRCNCIGYRSIDEKNQPVTAASSRSRYGLIGLRLEAQSRALS
jgi:hypothetical protein